MSRTPTRSRAAAGYGGFKTPGLAEDAQRREVERAWRAVAAAGRLTPMFKAFVKTVTGNDVQVIVNPSRTATDGKVLLIQPPIELGDPGASRHALGLCNEYAEDGLSLCGACRIQEGLLARVYHEISHCLFGSMDEPTDENLTYAAKLAAERTAIRVAEPHNIPVWEDHFLRALRNDRRNKLATMSFMGLASVVSEWLPLLVNLIEDMRVNERLFEYQPGMRRVLGGDIKNAIAAIMEDQRSGDKEFDVEFVAALAMYAEAVGWHELWRTRTDDDRLILLIEHDEVQALLETGRRAGSVGESFRIANELLAVCQGLGFFLDEPPEDDDKEEEDGEGDEGDGEGSGKGSGAAGKSGGTGSGTSAGGASGGDPGTASPGKRANGVDEEPGAAGDSGDDSSEPGDDDSDSDEDDDEGSGDDEGSSGESKGGDGSGDGERARNAAQELLEILGHDEGLAEDVAKIIGGVLKELESGGRDSSPLGLAIGQAAWFKGPSKNIGGVQVTRLGDGKVKKPRGQRWEEFYERSLAGQTHRDAEMFVGKAEAELVALAAREAGKARLVFAANRAIRTTRNKDHGKIYAPTLGRKLKTEDYKVFGTKERPDKRDYAVLVGMDISGSTAADAGRSGMCMNELIRRCGFVQLELLNKIGVGNTACYAHTGEHFDGGHKVSLYEVKSWGDKWDRQAKARIDALNPASANLDGHTFEAYLKILERVQATDKILLYFTDGAMPAENYDEELQILKATFQRTKRMNNLHILTVGVQNDDPLQYGLDMVRLDSPGDIGKVTSALRELIK